MEEFESLKLQEIAKLFEEERSFINRCRRVNYNFVFSDLRNVFRISCICDSVVV